MYQVMSLGLASTSKREDGFEGKLWEERKRLNRRNRPRWRWMGAYKEPCKPTGAWNPGH